MWSPDVTPSIIPSILPVLRHVRGAIVLVAGQTKDFNRKEMFNISTYGDFLHYLYTSQQQDMLWERHHNIQQIKSQAINQLGIWFTEGPRARVTPFTTHKFMDLTNIHRHITTSSITGFRAHPLVLDTLSTLPHHRHIHRILQAITWGHALIPLHLPLLRRPQSAPLGGSKDE